MSEEGILLLQRPPGVGYLPSGGSESLSWQEGESLDLLAR